MSIKEKLQLAELSKKFDVKADMDEDGKENGGYTVLHKGDTANLRGEIAENGEYNIFQTNADEPINLEVVFNMSRFCKLLAK